jgi:hypothetical protein
MFHTFELRENEIEEVRKKLEEYEKKYKLKYRFVKRNIVAVNLFYCNKNELNFEKLVKYLFYENKDKDDEIPDEVWEDL